VPDVEWQVSLVEGEFTMQPAMTAVADAAAGVIDGLLTTMRRSLVILAVPSLNVYARPPLQHPLLVQCTLTRFADIRQNLARRPM
jgi:hypothetical protein